MVIAALVFIFFADSALACASTHEDSCLFIRGTDTFTQKVSGMEFATYTYSNERKDHHLIGNVITGSSKCYRNDTCVFNDVEVFGEIKTYSYKYDRKLRFH